MKLGGLVLAAGEGRRFGGTKQLAPLRGRPGARGLYLKYEDYLIEVLGPGVGAVPGDVAGDGRSFSVSWARNLTPG